MKESPGSLVASAKVWWVMVAVPTRTVSSDKYPLSAPLPYWMENACPFAT